MIEIKKPYLLLRFGNYKKYDFIREHQRLIAETGDAWMLKLGKPIPAARMKKLFANGGCLLLKAPKNNGGRFFAVNVKTYYLGEPSVNMHYPAYYMEMVKDEHLWSVEKLIGTWFNIDNITELPDEFCDRLYLVSNNKKVSDVLSITRTSSVYVYYDETKSV